MTASNLPNMMQMDPREIIEEIVGLRIEFVLPANRNEDHGEPSQAIVGLARSSVLLLRFRSDKVANQGHGR